MEYTRKNKETKKRIGSSKDKAVEKEKANEMKKNR
jgi:hypothetical protein